MDETQNQTEPVTTPEVTTQPPVEQPEPVQPKKNTSFATLLVVGAVVVAVAAVVIVFFTGQGDEQTIGGIAPNQVVATVNGTDIVGADLATSIGQITATARFQGIDTTDPGVQAEIQAQAVEMLINTAILEEEAAERGINITDTDVEARIASLIQEIGSEEALDERMGALGIDQETLEQDIKSELMIQQLLDQVFVEEQITVTDEEVVALYETSTAGDEAAPALDEVRAQVEDQIRASKEQAAVDAFISSLRTEADVEISE